MYRGGSTEFGVVNAYTRNYVFPSAYQYYGIRTSQISLDVLDADPEIDSIAAFVTTVPEPGTALLLSLGLVGLGAKRRGWEQDAPQRDLNPCRTLDCAYEKQAAFSARPVGSGTSIGSE